MPRAAPHTASNARQALASSTSTLVHHLFAGLTTPNALNPLAAVLELLGESLETVKYDPLGTFHMERGKPGLRRHADLTKLVAEVRRFSPTGADELEAAVPRFDSCMTRSVDFLPQYFVPTGR